MSGTVCPPGGKISSKEYVRRVYQDAMGYYEGMRVRLQRPTMDVYGFIDLVSRQTGDRLRTIGAHTDSSRWNKTAYLIAFNVLWTDDVDCTWLTEWEAALDTIMKSHPLPHKAAGQVLFDNVAPTIGRVASSISITTAVLAVGALIVLDGYSEVKSAAKRRIS